MKGYFRGKPIGLGLRLARNNTPEGLCICCRGPAKRKSASRDAVRKRRGRSEYYDTCRTAACQVGWFKLWRRDQRAEVSP